LHITYIYPAPSLYASYTNHSLQDWEHYSSIRNLDGPHSGLPDVAWKKIPPEDQQGGQAPKKLEYAGQWKINAVKQSLPFLTDLHVIIRALEDCKGNIDNAVSMLIDADQEGSVSSTQGSSSIERDPDSDDEVIYGPNKRATYSRQRRAARNLMRERGQERREMAAKLAQHDGSQESVSQGMSILEIPDSQDNSPRMTPGDDFDDDWTPDKSDGIATPELSKGPTRLKITMSSKSSDIGKTSVRQPGPRTRPPSARERKEQKKTQQKAARKARAQQAAKSQLSGASKDGLPILTKPKAATPVVEGGMRTLYI
jgi:OTU domain-containing protein 3